MKIYLLFFITVGAWSPSSWRTKLVKQIPSYPDINKLKIIENKIASSAPIIFAGECDNLQEKLAIISVTNNGFLLTSGDCAETFKDFNINKIKNTYKLMLQMSLILSYGLNVPVVKVGRIAGQFAKPRSDEYETINGTKVLTYRGDIINDIEINKREPNPERMLDAYYQSVQSLNILRGFSSGGFADVNKIHYWNLNFTEQTEINSKYRIITEKVTDSLNFFKALGFDTNDNKFKSTDFYTSHEALLLNYEEALTRQDSRSNKWYDCSAHLLWVGERTRQLDHAHVEFLSGINNPIGIKVSEKCSSDELLNLINILNPNNIPGKIVVITRMGKKIKECLPPLIRSIQNSASNVVWCCDPMHGNTITTEKKIKTRIFNDIKEEINDFFDIHKKMGSYPGGIHLELTGEDVTECIGGEINTINEDDLNKNYLSNCDPRLNLNQALELAFLIVEKMN